MPESWLFNLDLKLEEGLNSGSSAVSLLMSQETWRLASLEPILDRSASMSVRPCRGKHTLWYTHTNHRTHTHTSEYLPYLLLWFLFSITEGGFTAQTDELTDSLSEAEESRDLAVLCRLNWLLMSEVWLVTVERRVDMKLLLVERRSRGWTQSKTPRHGMYLANAILQRQTDSK